MTCHSCGDSRVTTEAIGLCLFCAPPSGIDIPSREEQRISDLEVLLRDAVVTIAARDDRIEELELWVSDLAQMLSGEAE